MQKYAYGCENNEKLTIGAPNLLWSQREMPKLGQIEHNGHGAISRKILEFAAPTPQEYLTEDQKCNKCGKNFETRRELKQHQLKNPNGRTPPSYQPQNTDVQHQSSTSSSKRIRNSTSMKNTTARYNKKKTRTQRQDPKHLNREEIEAIQKHRVRVCGGTQRRTNSFQEAGRATHR